MNTIIKIKDDYKSNILYIVATFLEEKGYGCIVNHKKATINVMEKWRKEAELRKFGSSSQK